MRTSFSWGLSVDFLSVIVFLSPILCTTDIFMSRLKLSLSLIYVCIHGVVLLQKLCLSVSSLIKEF